MASDPLSGMGGFLPNMLGDLLRLLKTDAPFPIELAEQLAISIASEGAPRAVDPLDRIRLEELIRIADLQVGDITGMTTGVAGQPVGIRPLTRPDWARDNLASWRPSLEALALELKPDPRSMQVNDQATAETTSQDLAGLIGQWAGAVAPAMIAMQFGSLIGHLASSTLGQYELILPRASDAEITVVPENAARFAEDWSLSADDVAYYLTVRDVTLQAVMSRPHVRERVLYLILQHAKGFRPDPAALESAFGDISFTDTPGITEISQLLGAPNALGEMADTPEHRQIGDELATLAAAIGGYAEWVTRTVSERSIGSSAPIIEALRRRRVERGENERLADSLFGLAIDQAAIDKGENFVRGVLGRGAERELAGLFVVPEYLPTPAEIGAPGLWIERVNLPAAPASEP